MKSIEATKSVLLVFEKDGVKGNFDIINGKFDYTGDLPVTDAARMLFEVIANNCDEWWIERMKSNASTT